MVPLLSQDDTVRFGVPGFLLALPLFSCFSMGGRIEPAAGELTQWEVI
jgi:hypothetical protein